MAARDIKTKKIEYEFKVCGGFKKYLGLMFSKKKVALFFLNNKKYLWHGFFVFYPLTLYFLDKNFKIIEKAKLKPFSFYKQKQNAFYCIEIPVDFENHKKILKEIKLIVDF